MSRDVSLEGFRDEANRMTRQSFCRTEDYVF